MDVDRIGEAGWMPPHAIDAQRPLNLHVEVPCLPAPTSILFHTRRYQDAQSTDARPKRLEKRNSIGRNEVGQKNDVGVENVRTRRRIRTWAFSIVPSRQLRGQMNESEGPRAMRQTVPTFWPKRLKSDLDIED